MSECSCMKSAFTFLLDNETRQFSLWTQKLQDIKNYRSHSEWFQFSENKVVQGKLVSLDACLQFAQIGITQQLQSSCALYTSRKQNTYSSKQKIVFSCLIFPPSIFHLELRGLRPDIFKLQNKLYQKDEFLYLP